MVNNKVLIISYYFPPFQRVGGRRWAKHAKFLYKKGVDFKVLTGLYYGDSPWSSDIEEFENKIDQELKNHNCQIICLAGFMRILTKNFTDKWLGKMINIHPSLLPKYKGANAIKQAFDAGEGESGCTVHYVNEKVDDGQIIAQRSIEIKKNDSLNDVKRKILKEELEIFPLAIAEITKEMRNE